MGVIVGDLAGKILSYHTKIQANIAVKSAIKVVQVGDKNCTCKEKKLATNCAKSMSKHPNNTSK